MPIGNLDVPVIGKNTVIAVLVQTHILFATFIIGAVLIAATSEYLGVVTKQPQYERFARNLGRFVVLLFASGAALAITFVLSLITLFPVFFSYLQNVFFWLMAMTMIDAVASYMLTPAEAPVTEVARTFLNQTMIPLNMHRFVGNFSYAGFLIAGWGAFRYLRSTREEDREYYDWMGHWGLIWGFGFLILQPVIGYGYLKGIRESAPEAFDTIMLGSKSWLFLSLMIEVAVMTIAATAYFVHKLRFAAKPTPTLRKLSIGALGFMTLFAVLNIIPADANLIPQIGLTFGGGEDTKIPLGSMYPWKYVGLIGLMLVGFFIAALYLRATASGFQWGRASRWSQFALIACAVVVVFTMMTMGYTRETARRVDNDPGYLIYNCITLEQELTPAETCPAGDSLGGGG